MAENTEKDTSGQEEVQQLLKTVNAARRDARAFGELYRLLVDRVFRYLYSRVGSRSDAEDLTAQTFLAAYEALPRLRQDDRFLPWLFSIARSKLNDHYRRRRPLSPLDPDGNRSEGQDPLALVILAEQDARLSGLIQALPEQEQELLRLRYLGELRFAEMARLLNRREDAVKKQLYRLLERLHAQMEVGHE